MRILFMGTPDFALPSVRAVFDADCTLIGVVTQPDRERGRGQKKTMSPVKQWAVENDIVVYQPERASDSAFIETVAKLSPDLIITAAYGQILSQSFLDIPKLGCINVHASLLPKYRGASPIHQAIMDGCRETGITIMYMEKKMDAGDIILQESICVGEGESYSELHDRLALLGGVCVKKTLRLFCDNPHPQAACQNFDDVSYCGKIEKSMGKINWETWSAKELCCRVRALSPFPGVFTFLDGKRVKIHAVTILDENSSHLGGLIEQANAANGIIVTTYDGLVRVSMLQPEGKKVMSDVDFIKGYPIEAGTKLQ